MDEHFNTIRRAMTTDTGRLNVAEREAREKAIAIAGTAILQQVVTDLHRIAAALEASATHR